MKLYQYILALVFIPWLVSCSGGNGIEKTDTGINVEIGAEGPATRMSIEVVNEKTIRVTALLTTAMETPEKQPVASGTPFDIAVNDITAEVQTILEGVRINKGNAEISFLDSVGNTLLNVMPRSLNINNIEFANSSPEEYKLIFSQNDVLSVNASPFSDPDTASPFIATDGYNILWRTGPRGSYEEYYLIFGEEINYYLHKKNPPIP